MSPYIRPSVLPPSYNEACPVFTLFSNLPAELRAKIWQTAMKSRIIRWTRNSETHMMTGPSRSLPLMSVCQESREAAFLYGGYRNLAPDDQDPLYFSPRLDYLWLDPGWVEFGTTEVMEVNGANENLKVLLKRLGALERVMIHPNWSGRRRRPTVLFGEVPTIRTILVAADEKSIGLHGKVMLETVKEIEAYYASLKSASPVSKNGGGEEAAALKTPYIAVGCVGWVGEERRKMHHGTEDHRQLVKVFERQWEMNAHLQYLREEEWQFTHRHFERPKIAHKLRFVREKEEEGRKALNMALQAE
jgi:hypothetical protein